MVINPRHQRYVIFSVIAAVVGYCLWLISGDAQQAGAILHNIGLGGVLFIFGMSLANYLVRYLRWTWFLRQSGDNYPWHAGIAYYFAGFALTTTPGKAGEILRAVYFRNRLGVPAAHTIAAFVTERFTDALSCILIALPVFIAFPQFRPIAGLLLGLISCAFVAMRFREYVARFSLHLHSRSRWALLKTLLSNIPQLLDKTAALFSLRILLTGTLLGAIGWGTEALAFAWMVQTSGVDASLSLLAAIFTVSMLAGAASFLPGGLGGAEFAMALMLGLIGVQHGEAAALTVFCRIATLWFAVIIGNLTWLWLERRVPLTADETADDTKPTESTPTESTTAKP